MLKSSATDASTIRAPGMPHSRLMVLLFSDVVGSTDLKGRLGTVEYASLLAKHDQIFREIVESTHGAQVLKDTGDGFFASFLTASDAVRAALRFQTQLHAQAPALQARIGLHLGEVAEMGVEQDGLPKLVGLAADFAARLMTLAAGRQILMTRVTFNDARQFVRAHPTSGDGDTPELRWVAHGQYLFQGTDEPMEVFEVGAVGIAPLAPPADSPKARRNVRPGDEVTLGWRPAGGLELRDRPHWIIRQKLGEGGFGEVWLAEHAKTGMRRVFKFCFEPNRLRALKREVVLFRLLKDALGDRRDIARVIDYQFEENPYFIETEYFPDGTLHNWAVSRGGLSKIPLAERINVVAKVAEALSAAHSVGVLHKDLKPSNILMRDDGQGAYPVITDFGIGILTDRSLLAQHDITVAGFTQSAITENESSRTGTRLYAPPESLLNQPFTVQGDVYALGVMLYQVVVEDLSRPLAEGLERDVDNELLREDIAACVEGDPQRRLTSAAELASRLNRLAERRDQRARAAAAAQVATRRQQLIKVMVGLLVVAIGLAVGLGAALFERSRRVSIERDRSAAEAQLRAEAEAARDRSKLDAQKAELVTRFLTDMLSSADPARTNTPDLKVRDVLDRAARAVEEMKLSPQVEASIRAAIGRTYLVLGLYPSAEKQISRAVDLSRMTSGMSDRATLKAYSDLGVYYLYTGKFDEAEKIFLEAARLRETALGANDPDTADSLYNLSLLYGSMRRYEQSEKIGRRALAIRERIFGPDSKEVAASLQYLAQYANEAGKYAEAEPLYLRSLELRSKLLGPDHWEVGTSHNNLGLLYLNTGRKDQAREHFVKAVGVLSKSLGEAHPNVAMAKTNLANAYLSAGEADKARPLLEEALRTTQSARGRDHPDLVFTLFGLGGVYYTEKNYAAAEATYSRGLTLAEKSMGPDALITIAIRRALGSVYRDNQKFDLAEPLLRQSIDGLQRANNELEALKTEAALVECLIGARKFEEAEQVAIALRGKVRDLSDQQGRLSRGEEALGLLIKLYEDWNKPDQARPFRQELAAIARPTTSPATIPSGDN